MAVIESGVDTTEWSIDPTSFAGRMTLYDYKGNNRGTKPTYRASTTTRFVAVAGTAPFFLMYGSSSKTVIVQRIIMGAPTLTASEIFAVNVAKYSTGNVGAGTPVALIQTAIDSTNGAATLSLCSVYTAAPTPGTLVGTIESQTVFASASGAPVNASPNIVYDFRTRASENTGLYLRGTTQGIGLLFPTAPGSAVTTSVIVEWTEE